MAVNIFYSMIIYLEIRPSRVNKNFLLFHSDFTVVRSLLQNRERSENVFFNHFHDEVEMGDDQRGDAVLLVKQLSEFLEIVNLLFFFFIMLLLVVVIILVATELELLYELILEVL